MIRRLRSERGFTLIELLIATTIGTIVVLASFTLVDLTVDSQARTENRLSALARGRSAMEIITRQVRSQICLGRGIPPIVSATDDRIVFYAGLGTAAQSTASTPRIERRTLEFIPEPDLGGGRGYVQQTVEVGAGTPPDVTFTGTPVTTRIAENVSRAEGIPFFRYYRYDPVQSPDMLLLTPAPATGLADADRRMTVQVRTTFDAWPDNVNRSDRITTQLDSKVLVRLADPSDPTRSPQCI